MIDSGLDDRPGDGPLERRQRGDDTETQTESRDVVATGGDEVSWGEFETVLAWGPLDHA